MSSKLHGSVLVRYAVNGIAATLVHYSVLFVGIEIIQFRSAGMANLLASLFGISASFLGNRHYVFRSTREDLLFQATKFIALYTAIALLHGTTLYIWTDLYNLNYNLGFLIAVLIQFSLGYLGGKTLVFSESNLGNDVQEG